MDQTYTLVLNKAELLGVLQEAINDTPIEGHVVSADEAAVGKALVAAAFDIIQHTGASDDSGCCVFCGMRVKPARQHHDVDCPVARLTELFGLPVPVISSDDDE